MTGLPEAIWLLIAPTKQELWDWFKAENRYSPPKEERRPLQNRVARRRMTKQLTKLFKGQM